ncbi:MAG: PDZ domain-containing protein [Anaerolineae bacterium]|nr:PDZ domain-containing protein [Anaerolineae bacterium]
MRNRFIRILVSILAVMTIVTGVAVVSAQSTTEATGQPYLGINYGPDDHGALVMRVVRNSPAADAGLKVGDVITAVNGEAVTADNLADTVSALKVGDDVTLSITRDGEAQDLTATLAAQPAQSGGLRALPPMRNQQPPMLGQHPGLEQPYLGVRLQATDGGVSIVEVVASSPAADAGLMVDDVITAINGTAVAQPVDVAAAIRDLKPGDDVTVSITRDGAAQDISVTLGSVMNQMTEMMGDVVMYNGENWQVVSLSDSSPLAEAGLQSGDVVTAIDGESYAPADLANYLSGLAEDATVTLTVERDGESMDLTVNAADLSALGRFGFGFGRDMDNFGGRGFEFRGPNGQFNLTPGSIRLGVQYQDLNADVAAAHDLTVTDGALITDVLADSPAAEAGLQVDDVVTAVDGDAVDAEHTLRDRLLAYEAGDTITLDVLRSGETSQIDVTLAEVSLQNMMPNMPFDFGGEMPHFFFGPRGNGSAPAQPAQPTQPGNEAANL